MLNTTNGADSPEIKSSFTEWLDNFWYHYKWHSIVAIFLIITILVCSLQMCSKTTPDIYITYAGSIEIGRTSEDGDIPEYNRLKDILAGRAVDLNGDGDAQVTLATYLFLSEEEKAEIEANPAYEVNYTLLDNDRKNFEANYLYGSGGDFNIAFISPHVYEHYREVADVELFTPIAPYLDPDYDGYELYSDRAVLLSSLPIYQESATLRAIFPPESETMVVMRIKSYTSSIFDKGGTDNRYAACEDYLRALLGE